ncbi:MAG TPA: efflux RND transporter permease subunit, partial [Proteobacteria bacterium]|nr:efflux RND transporter permease subunit [Pseudomonadota bacterium]
MLITDASIARRTTVFVLMLIILVVGLFSYVTLPRESRPDITIPYILVQTTYKGAAAEDVENLITIPLERKLRGIKDVEKVRSVSAEGASMITVEFVPNVVIDDALQRVRDKVDQVKGDLPDDLESDPLVLEINLSEFPVLMIAVSGQVGERVLKKVSEDLQDRIEEIPGVLEVDITGSRKREIRVEFDPDRMAAYRLSFSEILSLIRKENVNVPGGSIDLGHGKYLLRVPGEFSDPRQIDNLVLLTRDGKPVYLKDVATVRDTFEDPRSYARINGRTSVTLAVKKRTGENIIELSDRVFHLLDVARPLLPPGVDVAVTLNESKDIRRMVSELENNIITGLILVLGVLFLFLGLRSAIFVALAIPFSMLISFTVLQAMGITLNMVVLFSLILALGMLVDNAIVIVENIFRHMQEGRDRVDAARTAVAEVGWPVIASTITTLCAFGPMLFWPGIMGEFMKYLPTTLIVVLSASLFVALVINPVLCATFLKAGKKAENKKGKEPVIIRLYSRILGVALNHRIMVVFSSFILMGGIIGAYVFLGNGVELFPSTDPNRASIEVQAPPGTNLDTTDALVRTVELDVKNEVDLKYVIAGVGLAEGGGGGTDSRLGKVSVEFVDRKQRHESSTAVIKRIRESLRNLSGADVKVEKEKMGPPAGAPVEVQIRGESVEVLSALVEKVKGLIQNVPGLVDMEDDLSRAQPEITVVVDREKASLLGLSTIEISNTVKAAISGWKLGDYREGSDDYDIIARLPERSRRTFAQIENLLIPRANGDPVPLSTVAHLRMGTGYGAIRHLDQKRLATVTANTSGRSSIEVLKDVRARLKQLDLPGGYS